MFDVIPAPTDDPAFIEIVSRILAGAVSCYRPKEIYVIQIDRRFDRKWLRFSGKVLGALGIWGWELRVPPFVPERVVRQWYYQADQTSPGAYSEAFARPLHIHQTSGDNQFRFLRRLTTSGLFIWYSGNSERDAIASVMVYREEHKRELAWYVSYVKTGEWKIESVSGIPRRTFVDLTDLSSETIAG